jgi:hypothetical protein
MITEIAHEEGFPLRTALLYQDRLPLGGLGLRKGMFLLRHGVPLGDTSLAEIEWTIRLLANESLRMRVNLATLPLTAGSAFTNYED